MITTNCDYGRESLAELDPQLPHPSFSCLDRACVLNKQGFDSKSGFESNLDFNQDLDF